MTDFFTLVNVKNQNKNCIYLEKWHHVIVLSGIDDHCIGAEVIREDDKNNGCPFPILQVDDVRILYYDYITIEKIVSTQRCQILS